MIADDQNPTQKQYAGPERRLDFRQRQELLELERVNRCLTRSIATLKKAIRRTKETIGEVAEAARPPSRQCSNCQHLFDDQVEVDPREGLEVASAHACRAFPGGIPEAITEERHDHRRTFKGKEIGGILFEPRDDRAIGIAGQIDFVKGRT